MSVWSSFGPENGLAETSEVFIGDSPKFFMRLFGLFKSVIRDILEICPQAVIYHLLKDFYRINRIDRMKSSGKSLYIL